MMSPMKFAVAALGAWLTLVAAPNPAGATQTAEAPVSSVAPLSHTDAYADKRAEV